MDRVQLAAFITTRLEKEKIRLKQFFSKTQPQIGYFIIDDLLPKNIAEQIHTCFPDLTKTKERKNLREHKHVAYQMNQYHPLLEEVIYAFQEKSVVHLIAEICNIQSLLPDENLYAGGLSLMAKDNYLSPHLDNSHDKNRELWRVLNVLYYTTPNWKDSDGGNLELWPSGLKRKQVSISCKFNRLVVMATHQKSWHSVSKVSTNFVRCCVSNYYFSEEALLENDNFHVTTFRGRPSQKVKDVLLKLDNGLRSSVRKFFKKGIRENPHQYKK
ncbi:MAG: 2OG-Fe(II) oxygenase [Polaribacter sp.]